jgi:hypothetical protein
MRKSERYSGRAYFMRPTVGTQAAHFSAYCVFLSSSATRKKASRISPFVSELKP